MKRTYDAWFKAACTICAMRYGVSLYDLPNMPYRDWYDDGISPLAAARRAWGRARNDY